jgi:hypothetical protein
MLCRDNNLQLTVIASGKQNRLLLSRHVAHLSSMTRRSRSCSTSSDIDLLVSPSCLCMCEFWLTSQSEALRDLRIIPRSASPSSLEERPLHELKREERLELPIRQRVLQPPAALLVTSLPQSDNITGTTKHQRQGQHRNSRSTAGPAHQSEKPCVHPSRRTPF